MWVISDGTPRRQEKPDQIPVPGLTYSFIAVNLIQAVDQTSIEGRYEPFQKKQVSAMSMAGELQVGVDLFRDTVGPMRHQYPDRIRRAGKSCV